mmetsp:Transcript_98063/g.184396  ORF Transcript_98063/g.184396 Transcript_98063/m.184396 type:complete len:238 (+) Transcript_98063:106-819(+)
MFKMRVFLQLFTVLVILGDVAAKPKRRRRKAGPEEPKVKTKLSSDGLEVKNFEDTRKVFNDKCVKDKQKYFMDAEGRPYDRSFVQFTEIISEEIAMNAKVTRGDQMTTTTTTSTTTNFKGKRGKLRDQLMAAIGGNIADRVNAMPNSEQRRKDQEKQKLLQMSVQQINQVVKRTKLPPDHRYTAREFCDILWRSRNPSLLDNEAEVAMRHFDPWKEHEKVPDAYDDDEEDEEGTVEL